MAVSIDDETRLVASITTVSDTQQLYVFKTLNRYVYTQTAWHGTVLLHKQCYGFVGFDASIDDGITPPPRPPTADEPPAP